MPTNRSKQKMQYIKDKSLVRFLLSHLKPREIDLSLIKIPPFLDILAEHEKNEDFQEKKESQN